MCIAKKGYGHSELAKKAVAQIQIGDIVTVTDEGPEIGGWYELAEYPDLCWYKSNFAPLSKIDESEMIRENLLVKLNP